MYKCLTFIISKLINPLLYINNKKLTNKKKKLITDKLVM